jgi:hypothetical protein
VNSSVRDSNGNTTCTAPDEDVVLASGVPSYCSSDRYSLWLLPLQGGVSTPGVRAYDMPQDPDCSNVSGAANPCRYPKAFDQSVNVLEQARRGAFGSPIVDPNYKNPIAGRLFVPQHSGIQP